MDLLCGKTASRLPLSGGRWYPRFASGKIVSLLLGFLAFGSANLGWAAEKAVQSDAFVDSAGINVHLHYTDTPYYSQYSLIQASLVQLGVRHIRDGVIDTTLKAYYDRHNALGALGIKGTFITGPTQTSSLFASFPTRVAQSFEGFENPNEYDVSSDTNWNTTLKGSMPVLYSAAKTLVYPATTVIGPSMVKPTSSTTLGDISAYVDYGNMHNYYSGANPGTPGWYGAGASNFGSIAWNKQTAQIMSKDKPMISTETGYTNDLTLSGSVPEDVSAVYMPRVFLEQWLGGVKRTYLYELLSVGGEDYGLLRKDGTVKPAFPALANLLNLLSDRGAAFEPSSLDYTLTGGNANVHHLLMQKRNGVFYLALWVESQGYNPNTKSYTPVSSQRVTLYVPHTLNSVKTYQWDATGNVTTQTLGSSQNQTLTVTDKLQIVEINLLSMAELTTNVTPAIGGALSITPKSSDGIYDSGQYVTLTASPATGYVFKGYSGSSTESSSVANVPVVGKTAVTANFSCGYQLSSSALAVPNTAGTVTVTVTSGTSCSWTPQLSDSWISVPATTQSGTGSFVVNYAANTGAARTAVITVGESQIVLSQAAGVTVPLTYTSSPLGATIVVHGRPVVAPYTEDTPVGSTITASVASQQSYGGNVYLLYGWLGTSDGASANAAHTIVAPSKAATYTVNMVQGQKLTTSVVGSGSVRVDPDRSSTGGYYKPTDKVNIYATPASGCTLGGFSGSAATVMGSVATVYMTQAASITATFKCNVSMTFNSSPSGAVIQVDGKTVATPYVLSALAGSSHQVSVATQQSYGGNVYLLYGWSGTTDGASANAAHTIATPSSNSTYTVNMVPGQLLTTSMTAGGVVRVDPDRSSTGNYYKPTDKVNITAVPNTGCVFTSFSGSAATVKGTVATVFMTQPASITASFSCSK